MKMASGGFRPAYNVHFATDVHGRAIVGVQVTNSGSDHGLLPPMLVEIRRRTGRQPAEYFADGGFMEREVITQVTADGLTIYGPTPKARPPRDPAAPLSRDTPAVAASRVRMQTPEAKDIYKDCAATAAWVNADARAHRTLAQIAVRGLTKVHTSALWAALAHYMFRLTAIVPHLMT